MGFFILLDLNNFFLRLFPRSSDSMSSIVTASIHCSTIQLYTSCNIHPSDNYNQQTLFCRFPAAASAHSTDHVQQHKDAGHPFTRCQIILFGSSFCCDHNRSPSYPIYCNSQDMAVSLKRLLSQKHMKCNTVNLVMWVHDIT